MFVLIWRFVENPTASANLGFYHLKMAYPENGAPHDLDPTAGITPDVWRSEHSRGSERFVEI